MWPSGKPSTLPSAPPGIPAAASPFKSKPTSLFDGIFDDVLSKSKSAAAHVPEHPSYLASLGTDDVHDQLESIAAEGRKTNLGNVTLEVYPLKSVGDKSHVFDQPAVSMNICEQTGVWSAYARLYFSDEYKMDATNWTEDFGVANFTNTSCKQRMTVATQSPQTAVVSTHGISCAKISTGMNVKMLPRGKRTSAQSNTGPCRS